MLFLSVAGWAEAAEMAAEIDTAKAAENRTRESSREQSFIIFNPTLRFFCPLLFSFHAHLKDVWKV